MSDWQPVERETLITATTFALELLVEGKALAAECLLVEVRNRLLVDEGMDQQAEGVTVQ